MLAIYKAGKHNESAEKAGARLGRMRKVGGNATQGQAWAGSDAVLGEGRELAVGWTVLAPGSR